MKKFLLAFIGLTSIVSVSNAQLRVMGNGHVQIGDWTWPRSSEIFRSMAETQAEFSFFKPDTTATVSINGPGEELANGEIIFGGRRDVVIREYIDDDSIFNRPGALHITGKGGFSLYCNGARVLSYDPFLASSIHGDSYFVFAKGIKAPEFLTTSDLRLKKDISSIESLGRGLVDLSPVRYAYNVPNENEDGVLAKSSAASDAEESHYFGFIAQEVREIFPDLVREDEDGLLSINYTGFIPLLVDAYKDLLNEVEQQRELIASLSGSGRKTKGTAGIDSLSEERGIVLMQNRPNPFSASTEIRCTLPDDISDAFICIYDLNGRQQKRIEINGRGDVSVTVSGNSLQAGMYIYTLIADGQEIDSKRMILTE